MPATSPATRSQLALITARCTAAALEKRRPRKMSFPRLWCGLHWGCQSIDIILTCARVVHAVRRLRAVSDPISGGRLHGEPCIMIGLLLGGV